MKTEISVGILAGGNSSRMGTDKALIRIGNERFIDRISDELGSFSEIIVSAGTCRTYEELGFKTVYDENVGIGPMEGIRQILRNADTEYVFICAADMPFIKKELVRYMLGYISSDHDCYVVADEDHIHPLCAIYKKSAIPVIEELISNGQYRLREIFARIPTKYITLDFTVFDRKIIRNINTREELADATKPYVFCVSGLSDTGKTGLIERLVNEFKDNKMTVGVIKHDPHDLFSDLTGSDTDRYKRAGAVASAIFSDRRYAAELSEKTDTDKLIRMMEKSENPPDVIIIEGMKDSKIPKIEVIRKSICDHGVCEKGSLICIAADHLSPNSSDVPVFDPEDAKGIFSCVMKYFEG